MKGRAAPGGQLPGRGRRTRGGRPRYAQAFLTTSNLPDTIDGLLEWVGDDPWNAITPVDEVLGFDPAEEFSWTAPARVDVGDLAFFHYAARAKARIITLRRAAAREGVLDAGLADFLDHVAEQAEEYAGRVFAYGVLSGPAEPRPPEAGASPHWRSRLYAPFARVAGFAEPLLLRDHTDVLTQPTRTITELSAAEFGAIKERLAAVGNALGPDLEAAVPGRDDFDGISQATWRGVACRPEQQFRLEVEVRGYFADYLLEELKDPGTTVYREARCVAASRGRRRSGGRGAGRPGPRRPDYVIRLGGRWLPVEAKLSLWSWPDILDQVAPYAQAAAYDARAPGGQPVRLPAGSAGQTACLVIDQAGVYLVCDGAFYDSAPGEPLWRRADLARLTPVAARKRLLALLA